MLAATLLWGGTFVAVRDVVRTVSPVELVCARFAAAALVLAAALAARAIGARAGAGRARGAWRASLVGGAVAGVLAAGGYLFQAIGLTSTSAGSSAFLTCTGTALAPLFAWPLLGQRPTAVLAQGLALAIAGSFLMSVPVSAPGVSPAAHGWAIGPGEAWTLFGAVVYALQVVALGRWAPRADALALAAVQAAVIALALLPFAGGAVRALGTLGPGGGWRFLYLVLGGSVAAPLLQVVAQRTLPAGRVALLFALEPVFALLFALTLGGERFAPAWWAGALLVLSGVLRVEWRGAVKP